MLFENFGPKAFQLDKQSKLSSFGVFGPSIGFIFKAKAIGMGFWRDSKSG